VPERILSEESSVFLVQILVQNIETYYLSCRARYFRPGPGRSVWPRKRRTFTVNAGRAYFERAIAGHNSRENNNFEKLLPCYGRSTRVFFHHAFMPEFLPLAGSPGHNFWSPPAKRLYAFNVSTSNYCSIDLGRIWY
jgi:hypothetical protein